MATAIKRFVPIDTASTNLPRPYKRARNVPQLTQNYSTGLIPSSDIALYLDRLRTSANRLKRFRKRVNLKRKFLTEKLTEHRDLHPDVKPRGLKGGHARKADRIAQDRGISFKPTAQMDDLERAYDDHVHDHESWLRGKIKGLSTIFYMTEEPSIDLWTAVAVTTAVLEIICRIEAGKSLESFDRKSQELMGRAKTQLPRMQKLLAEVEETLDMWKDVI